MCDVLMATVKAFEYERPVADMGPPGIHISLHLLVQGRNACLQIPPKTTNLPFKVRGNVTAESEWCIQKAVSCNFANGKF
jgi:hypothetical protein